MVNMNKKIDLKVKIIEQPNPIKQQEDKLTTKEREVTEQQEDKLTTQEQKTTEEQEDKLTSKELKSVQQTERMIDKWVEYAIEIQSLAQAGLTYGKDIYDIERYTRLREISAEMLALKTDISVEKIKNLFCNETGYQTPKIDTRAAIIKDNKILLVCENNGTWSLPGGWCDVNKSIAENTIKETKEEAGLEVTPCLLIAAQDRNKHNVPVYAYGIIKMFVLCEIEGGEFKPNSETIKTQYFEQDKLPHNLALEKNTKKQIDMCFRAYKSKNWKTIFD